MARAEWQAGAVKHLLPAVSYDRILLKAGFERPLAAAPSLRIGSRSARGVRSDTAGEFFAFDVTGLEPERAYQLELLDSRGKPLCDPWPLSTFPSPGAQPRRLRLLVYTCAGGHPATLNPDTGLPYWVSIANRRKLLLAGLSHKPDAVIAIGDHVYWDLRSPVGSRNLGASPVAMKLVGEFARSEPAIGTDNERKLKQVVSPQVCDLYGTLFRSTPVFFLQDDHDYFENDEATPEMVTFPPDDFMLRLARATQGLYYPEFLPDTGRPLGLPGSSAFDRARGVSESFGTLRYGKLVEILMYDCRRYLTLKGPAGGFVPDTVESWLVRRMKAQETHHVINLPSTPVGWSAGKWGEWYPDLLQPDGRLGLAKPKYFWQQGWSAQHDRLLQAASAMQRIPLFLSGDLHALAEGKIQRYGRLDFRRNPIVSVLTGPISTGPKAWPSAWRGTPPQIPTGLELDEGLKPIEKNGFSIIEFTEGRVEIQFSSWKLDEPEDRLQNLKPFHRLAL
ncbi:MAG: alkaline phosphatase D family protein, partial [Bryobacteraceae bacterium]